MDWTIVVSVLVALLLWPVVLAFVGVLTFLTTATVFRGRIRGLKDRQMAQCQQMCTPGERATTAATPAAPESCR